MLDVTRIKKVVDQCWADEIIPTLVEYIKILSGRRPWPGSPGEIALCGSVALY